MEPSVSPAGPAGITPRQAIIIDLLATGLTITKAAEQGGIARKTLYNWRDRGIPGRLEGPQARVGRAGGRAGGRAWPRQHRDPDRLPVFRGDDDL